VRGTASVLPKERGTATPACRLPAIAEGPRLFRTNDIPPSLFLFRCVSCSARGSVRRKYNITTVKSNVLQVCPVSSFLLIRLGGRPGCAAGRVRLPCGTPRFRMLRAAHYVHVPDSACVARRRHESGSTSVKAARMVDTPRSLSEDAADAHAVTRSIRAHNPQPCH